jgi:hypothetical protein
MLPLCINALNGICLETVDIENSADFRRLIAGSYDMLNPSHPEKLFWRVWANLRRVFRTSGEAAAPFFSRKDAILCGTLFCHSVHLRKQTASVDTFFKPALFVPSLVILPRSGVCHRLVLGWTVLLSDCCCILA